MRLCAILLLILAGCSPNSLDDYHREGEAVCRLLVKDLRKVQSREDLAGVLPSLQKHIEHLVDIMIQARQLEQAHPEKSISFETPYNAFNEDLLLEMQRVYAIEGAKELIEKVQREPLLRLDAFEKTLQKQKQQLIYPRK